MVYGTSKANAQSDQSLCLSLEYSMTVKLLTGQHLEFLSLKRDCTGWSEATLVKMPHCYVIRISPINHYIIFRNPNLAIKTNKT